MEINPKSIIYRYLLEQEDLIEMGINLEVGGSLIEILNSQTVLVSKRSEEKKFALSDPNCACKISEYLKEKEDHLVYLCLNGYFRVVGKSALKEILLENRNFQEQYQKIWDMTRPVGVYKELPWNFYHIYCEEDFNEFVEEFLSDLRV